MTDIPEDRPRMARPRRPYPIATATARRIDRAFRRPAAAGMEATARDLCLKQLRGVCYTLASMVPPGEDLNTALKRIREAGMFAEAGIMQDPNLDAGEPDGDQ